MKRKALACLLGALTLVGVTACGGSDSGEGSGGGGGEGDGGGGGTIAVITVDPSNPYWKAEVDTAVAEAEKLGYETTVDAHNNDPDKQNQFIDGAISKGVSAIILDPAGADESIGAVQKATDADIPVFLVNAEITEQGIAKSQIVSNNAQGATLGAQAWAEAVGGKGKYVELFGNPTDNNAQVRSDGYAAASSSRSRSSASTATRTPRRRSGTVRWSPPSSSPS
jgi:erythritol transport system substrate-binding protein